MILLSHPTGNKNVREACLAFAENEMLSEFWTTLSWKNDSEIVSLLPPRFRGEVMRRAYPAAVHSRTRLRPVKEAMRLFASRWALLSGMVRHERGRFSIDAVYQDLDAAVAERIRRGGTIAVAYAYEDGALQTFEAASERGVRRIYDLPIGYWRAGRKIFQEEAAQKPEWASTLSGLQDSCEKLDRKDRELALAEVVIVASSFTRSTLVEEARLSAPIKVVPYGFEVGPEPEMCKRSNRPLRVLFVGGLSQRKGISYLFQAVEQLGCSVELTVIGSSGTTSCKALEAALKRHRWIPSLPNSAVLEEMRRHDVLVFPSLFEGFGLVIVEAMAQGIPVITTSHTAGPDLITDGIDGFLVPIRSSAAIAERLEELCRDRHRLMAMKRAAWETASRRSWAMYRDSLVALIRRTVTLGPLQEAKNATAV